MLAQVDRDISAARAVETPSARAAETSSAAAEVPASRATMANRELFTTREITQTDVRKIRNQMKKDPNLFPQFIANDGSIWSVRKISGSNGVEVLEIGPLGGPSLARVA